MDSVRLQTVVASTLNIPVETVTENLTMQDSAEWDSLRHMELILRIEREAGVELTGDEIATMTSYPAIKSALASHGIVCV